jgi:formate dehydrogenase iron-sulfur subunit
MRPDSRTDAHTVVPPVADDELAVLRDLLAGVPADAAGLLPALQAVQGRFGHVSRGAIRYVAQALNLSRAEVHGVVTFYGDLREAPVGDVVVQLCMAEACQAVGCRELARHAETALGVTLGETTADGRVHIEAAYCFGNCALGPSVRIDDHRHRATAPSARAGGSSRIHGRVTPARFDALLADVMRRGVQAGVTASAPAWTATVTGPAPPARVYVPNDTAARSVGADAVASAIEALGLTVVRNGSRGAAWLEPLVEIDTDGGRVGFGNIAADDVATLFTDGRLPTGAHPRSVGLVHELPWFAAQQRVTFARAGVIDPLSLDDYQRHGGWLGLGRALAMTPQTIIDEIAASGLRGRGGAAFPAGVKWRTVLDAPADVKYVVCNADEGDSGTFADRLLMEADPFQLIEGMTIAGLAVGAAHGVIYLRSEYPHTIDVMTRALELARDAGFLGARVMDTPHAFDIVLRVGAGAYICGEETALLESLEGRRGVVRAKPPLPALSGLFGRPTVVNNVLTLAAATSILAQGGAHYALAGIDRSTGTMPFQLGGNLLRGGLVELPFGVTLADLIERFGGGTASGRPMKAIQLGGPLGAYLPASLWQTPLGYEQVAAVGGMLGHGGIVVFDDTVDMGAQAEFAMAFCAHESCGKCTPCRIGSTRAVEVIGRIRRGESTRRNWQLLDELCETMELGSLCALGGLAPMPVRSVVRHFPGHLLASAASRAPMEATT